MWASNWQNRSVILKQWEIVVDKLSLHGWSWSLVSQIDPNGVRMFGVVAHRRNEKRYIIAREPLPAVLEFERQTLASRAKKCPKNFRQSK